MRLFYVVIVMVLIGALVAPYFLAGPDGHALMEAEDLLPRLPASPITVHRWQDVHGVWQFGESPPENAFAEAITVDPDADSTRLAEGWAGNANPNKKIKSAASDLLNTLQNPIDAARASAAAYESAANRHAP